METTLETRTDTALDFAEEAGRMLEWTGDRSRWRERCDREGRPYVSIAGVVTERLDSWGGRWVWTVWVELRYMKDRQLLADPDWARLRRWFRNFGVTEHTSISPMVLGFAFEPTNALGFRFDVAGSGDPERARQRLGWLVYWYIAEHLTAPGDAGKERPQNPS